MNEKTQTKIWENGNKGRCKKTRNQSFFWGGSDWTLRSLKDGRILFSMSWLTNKLYEYRDKIMNNVFSQMIYWFVFHMTFLLLPQQLIEVHSYTPLWL